MQYIIMIAIVLGLAISDFVTGIAKGYIKGKIHSGTMRKGGINKIVEILVMVTACGLEIGIKALGAYYNSEVLAKVTGSVAAVIVFGYIVIMEVVSIFENFAEINPDTNSWAKKIIKRLKNYTDEEDK